MKSAKSKRKSKRNFIRGIFNYCDRWCERCAFTDRCRCYAELEKWGLNDPARQDINDPAFWERLRATFQATKESLLRRAADDGIDLNDPELVEECKQHEHEVDRLAETHEPLLLKAKAYADFAAGLLDRPGSPIETADEDHDGFVEKLSPESRQEIIDALEIISYYHLFNYVKLSRAAHSWAEEKLETDRDLQELTSDADGSAKVALIGIDQSWLAWARLRHHVEEGEETILEALKQLSELREAAEMAFPAARGFVRPGFDDEKPMDP